MTPRDVLIAARAILVRDGWISNGSGYRDGPCCAYHACVRAATDLKEALEARGHLLQALDVPSLPDWNDSQTSIEPVLAAFDRAIERAT